MRKIKILLAVLCLSSISFPVFSADSGDDNQVPKNDKKDVKSKQKFEKGCDAEHPVKDKKGKCFSCDDVYLKDRPEIYMGKGICKEPKNTGMASRKKIESIKENNKKLSNGKINNNCPKDKPAMDGDGVCRSCSDKKIKSKSYLYKEVCPKKIDNATDKIISRNAKDNAMDKVTPIISRDTNTTNAGE